MKKWMKYVILSLAAIILCFLYAHVDKAHCIYDSKRDSSEYIAVNINKDSSFVQAFECPEKDLDGIAVKLLINNSSNCGKLIYVLHDSDGKTIVEGSIALSEIENGRMNKIKFDTKIEGTKGSLYTIDFKSEDLKEGESVGLYYENRSNQSRGLSINNEKVEVTLILKTITYRFDLETFIVTLGIILYFVLFFQILYKLFA